MKIKLTLLILLLSINLLACSTSNGPEQIAVYPQEPAIAVYPHQTEKKRIYNATLEVEVSKVERTAERAKDIAFEQGGYLVSSRSWFQDGEKQMTLVLAVPAHRFEIAYSELLRLGSLKGEWISSELLENGNLNWDVFSEITLYLHPRESKMPAFTFPNWRPVRTIEKAWEVFISIFGFLVDIVIWIVVVAGPFVLIGWSTKRLIQWWVKKTKQGALICCRNQEAKGN